MKTSVTAIDTSGNSPFVALSLCRRIKVTPYSTADDYQVQAPTQADGAILRPGGTPSEFTPSMGKDWFQVGDVAGYGKSLGAGTINFAQEEHVR